MKGPDAVGIDAGYVTSMRPPMLTALLCVAACAVAAAAQNAVEYALREDGDA